MDRGDYDREIIDLFERLRREAAEVGGQVISLIGNHELMNVDFDFSVVVTPSFESFDNINYSPYDPQLSDMEVIRRGRAAAFRPGGSYAKILAKRPVTLILEGTVFTHAGWLPEFAEIGIDTVNTEIKEWLRGRGKRPDYFMNDRSTTPTWLRTYGYPDPTQVDCESLREALDMLGAKRMVIGHTIQPGGVNAACDGLVWRVDVGIYEGRQIGALELIGDEITPLPLPWDSAEKYTRVPNH